MRPAPSHISAPRSLHTQRPMGMSCGQCRVSACSTACTMLCSAHCVRAATPSPGTSSRQPALPGCVSGGADRGLCRGQRTWVTVYRSRSGCSPGALAERRVAALSRHLRRQTCVFKQLSSGARRLSHACLKVCLWQAPAACLQRGREHHRCHSRASGDGRPGTSAPGMHPAGHVESARLYWLLCTILRLPLMLDMLSSTSYSCAGSFGGLTPHFTAAANSTCARAHAGGDLSPPLPRSLQWKLQGQPPTRPTCSRLEGAC